jgi:predicted nucleic acid-binding protein
MIVVDASVAAKWFLPETGSEEATQLLSGANKLIAPDLI